MAIAFSSTHNTGPWTYKRGGANPRELTTDETCTGDCAAARVYYGYNTQGKLFMIADFFASRAMTVSAADNSETTHYSGSVTTDKVNPSNNIFETKPSATFIDSVNSQQTNALQITNAANQVPGYNYTNATLYAALKERYPGYNSFGFRLYGTGGKSLTSSPTAAGLHSDYAYFSGITSDAVCKNAPGVSSTIPTSLTITGREYDGNPAILQGNNWANGNAWAVWLLLEADPPKRKCVVDMYFNGTKEPNISYKWAGYVDNVINNNDNILRASNLHIVNYAPGDITNPPYSAYYTYIDSETGIRRMNDLVFNRVHKLRYINPVAPGGDNATSYLSQVDGITGTFNTAQKILEYGINGIPKHLVWYLQVVDPDGNMSTLWEVVSPQESEGNLQGYTITEFTDAKWPNAAVALEVVLHSGANPDDITDDDTTPPPPPPKPDPEDWDDDEGHGFPGDAVLTTTYSMDAATLANIGQKLWTQSYFDVLKIQNNPIQNVVSVKWFPFNLNVGTTQSVKVGNVDFGINALKINSIKEIDIGSVTYNGVYGNFLDGSPYTTLKLNLPYVGQIQLDASEFLGCSIGVKYIVDLITGECVARVKRDGIPLYDYTGHMGVDIVLTASDRVQANMQAFNSGIHTAAGMAGELIQGDVIGATAGAASGALNVAGMDYNTQRIGAPSGACGSFQNHKVWLTVSYPLYYQSDGFTHAFGRPCNKYLSLSQFSSGDFVQVDKRADINICMTSDENAELEKLLTNGVYI